MNLVERLESARAAFSREYERINTVTQFNRNERIPISSGALDEMPVLGIAVTIIDYFSQDQIGHFVSERIAHPSTYAGASFPVAKGIYLNEYHQHKRSGEELKLDVDDIEQLYRTCHTAKNIVEKGLF